MIFDFFGKLSLLGIIGLEVIKMYSEYVFVWLLVPDLMYNFFHRMNCRQHDAKWNAGYC